MLPLNTNDLLKEIQSGEIEDFYINITTKALEWAVSGFVEETNQLLELLWSFGFAHSEQLRSAEHGLQVIWQTSGTMPTTVPFGLTTMDQIEKYNWSNVIYESGGAIYNTSLQQLSGNHLLATAITAAATQVVSTSVILEALDRFIHSADAVGYSYYQATTAACLIASRNHLPAETEKYIKLWGQGYLKYWYNYDVAALLKESTIIPILLQGVLAPVLMLTPLSIQKDIEAIKHALSKRVNSGRSLTYGHLSWQELLTNISTLALSQQSNVFSDEAVTSKWLGTTGATEKAIQNMEQRLGIRFPDDYREFLLTTNGFSSISAVAPALASTEYIDYFISYDRELVENWIEEVMQGDQAFGIRFRKSIVIGGQSEEQQLLLVPDDAGIWECWLFATWALGETRYPSFRFYMESQFKDLEATIVASE